MTHASSVKITSSGDWSARCSCGWETSGWSDAYLAGVCVRRHCALETSRLAETRAKIASDLARIRPDLITINHRSEIMVSKKKKNPVIVVDIPAKASAICNDPNHCLIGKDLRMQGYRNVEVTLDTISFSVRPDHARVEEFGGPGRYVIDTPSRAAHLIGMFDKPNGEQVLTETPMAVVIELDLTKAAFKPMKVVSPEKLAERAEFDRTNPERKAARLQNHMTSKLREVNALRRRRNMPTLTLAEYTTQVEAKRKLVDQ